MSAHSMRVGGSLYRYPTGRLTERAPIEALLAEIMARVTDEEERGEQMRIGEAYQAVAACADELGYLVSSKTHTRGFASCATHAGITMTETTDFTLADVPRLLRDYAVADVRHMSAPPLRSRVEIAAADEIERLRSVARHYADQCGVSAEELRSVQNV